MAARFPLEVIIQGVDRITAPMRKAQDRVAKALEPMRRLNNSLAGLKEAAGLTRVSDAFGKVTDRIGAASRAARDLVVRVGGIVGAAVGVATGLVLSFAHAGEELVRLSEKLGIGVEQLQEWQHAARLAEVEDGVLEKGLELLSKNVGQAAAGTGTARVAFRRLGIEVRGLDGKIRPLDELFPEIADKLNALGDDGRRTALTFAIFGRGGANMIPVLRRGSDGLREAAIESRRLGQMTAEDARLADEFGDAWIRMQRALVSVRNTIAKALVPVLGTLIVDLQEWFVANRDDISAWARAVAKEIPGVLKDVRDLLKDLRKELDPVIRFVKKLADRFGGARVALAGFAFVLGAPLLFALTNAAASILNLAVVMAFNLGPALIGATKGIWAFGAANIAVLGPIAAVLLAIGSVAYLGVVIHDNWEGLASFFTDTWATIKFGFIDASRGMVQHVPFWLKQPAIIIAAFKSLGTFFAGLWTGIRDGFSAMTDWIMGKVAALTSVVPDWLVDLLGGAAPALTPAGQAFAARGPGALGPRGGGAGGAGGAQGSAALRVSFEDLPRGARVTTIENKGVDLDLSMGYAFGSGP